MPFFEINGMQLYYHQQATMAAQIARSHHRIIPLAGLATNLENPQAVNQAIAEFLGGS